MTEHDDPWLAQRQMFRARMLSLHEAHAKAMSRSSAALAASRVILHTVAHIQPMVRAGVVLPRTPHHRLNSFAPPLVNPSGHPRR